MKILIRTPLLAGCLKKREQNLFGFEGVSAMNQRGSFALIMAALILTAGYNAQGQTFTNYLWNNSSTIYANATSWTNGVAPSGDTTARSNNIIQFSNFGANNNTVSLSASNTVGTILFSPTANSYTFDSTTSTVRLSTMIGITNNSTATQTFNLLVDTKKDNTWYQAAGGSMIFNTNVGLNFVGSASANTLTLTGGGTFDFKAGLTGALTNTGVGGTLVVNNSGGTVNLRASNSLSGMTLTAGTLNINNNNALGTGVLTLTGGATIDNTSGFAVVNAGNQAWTWNGTSAMNFGSATNTAANNLNLGTGTVTLSGTRAVNLLGTGTKLTIGDVINTSGSSFTANGTGNTLEMRGLSLSTSATPVTVTLAGTANLNVTGAIVSGTVAGNGLTVTATGTTTLSGNNTYTGLTTMNAAAGTLTLSGNNSTASGGVTLTAGTLNVNSANALGLGTLTLTAGTLNNTSGEAIVNAANNAVTWGGDLTFGTAGSNLNLGTGAVTASDSRTINLAGTGTKLTMGSVNITSTSSTGRTITANGAGNTLEMGGLSLSASATPVTVTLAGTANLNITGAIVNGTNPGNGLTVTNSGTTTFSGNNTYTGTTSFQSGTNIVSGDNRAAVGNVSISGSKTIVRLDNNNAISSSSSLLGSGSGTGTGNTLDFRAAGDLTFNSYGTATSSGNNIAFTNSSGSQKTVTFTNANNYITITAAGQRTVANNSSNLLLDFDGNIEIGSTITNTTTFTGAGNFNVDGNLLDTGVGGSRTLNKSGDGTLTLRGSGNNYRGSTTVDRGRLDLYGNVTVSTNITVSTNGTVSAASVTRPAAATLDVKYGATLLNNSTTTVYSGGNLVVNGTAGGVILESNGLLSGSGTVGNVNLKSGAFLTPGNSPGTLTAASAIVLGGSTYNWEISALTGTAGTNWDLFSVNGLLDMSGVTSANKWNLIVTRDSGFAGWTDTNSYSYVFAQAASVSGFSSTVGTDVTSLFNITTSGISSLPNTPYNANGDFKVVVGSENGRTTLNLMAVPEPSTGALLGFGLCGLVVTRLLRRKQS